MESRVWIKSLAVSNFKIHSELELSSVGTGLIRFHGNSGSGKSSMASAISYALFGKVWKSKGLCKYGETVFSVTLTLTNSKKDLFVIKRINSPKKLTLSTKKSGTGNGKLVKGDEAEEAIRELIGLTYFQYVWGVTLKNNISILEVSPQEKYLAICSLADIESEKLNEVTEKIQDQRKLITSRFSTLDQKIGKEEGILTVLNKKLATYSDRLNPVDLEDVEESTVEIPEETTLEDLLLEKQKELSKLNKQIKVLEEKILKFAKGVSEGAEMQNQLNALVDRRKTTLETLKESDGYTPRYVTLAKKAFALQQARERLEKTKEETKKESAKRRGVIEAFFEKNLPKNIPPKEYRAYVSDLRTRWSEYSSEVSTRTKLLKEKNSASLELTKLYSKVRNVYPTALEIKKSKAMVAFLQTQRKKLLPGGECPCCGTVLVYDSEVGSLVELDSTSSGDLNEGAASKTLTLAQIDSLIQKISEVGDVFSRPIPDAPKPPRNTLEKAEQILEEVETFLSELRMIEVGKSPEVTKIEKEVRLLTKDWEVDEDALVPEELTEDDIASYALLEKTHTKALSSLEILNKKIVTLEKQISQTESLDDLVEVLEERKEEKSVLETFISSVEKAIENERIEEELKVLQKEHQKHTEILNKLNEAKIQASNLLSGLKSLSAKIKEAKLISIQETIRIINQKAREYVKKLFDGPGERWSIYLTLASDSEGKEGKVSVKAVSRGGDHIKYDDLSDGEKQRARFAFFLGINDYLNPGLDMTIVDESLNQIEEERNSTSLEILKLRRGTNIVISHEALEGKFDKTILF